MYLTSLPFSYFRPTDFNTSHFNTSHEFLPCSPRWSGSCPAYTYKHTHRGGVPGLPGVGGNQERSTCRRTRSARSTRSTRTTTRARKSTRSTRSTRASTHAATPFVLVVPCAAASRRVAASRLPRGECSVVRGAALDGAVKWMAPFTQSSSSNRCVQVEMVSGDFSSSEQGRGNVGRAMPMRAERERDCARRLVH